MNLENVRILTDNFPAMFRFYSQACGLKPTWGDENSSYASFETSPDSPGVALFDRAEMFAALGLDPAVAESKAPRQILVFNVEYVDGFYEEGVARGVSFLRAPKSMTDWGIRTVHFQDPDGNWLEVYSSLPKGEWSEELVGQSTGSV